MSRVHEQADSNVRITSDHTRMWRSIDLQHCGNHFVCMSILESSFQVFSGLYFWFGGFHALFEILTSLSAESIAT
jgi:hypothetical protein